MTLVLLAVTRLAQRTQHEMSQNAFLRPARDFDRQLLIHARRDRDIFRYLVLTRSAAVSPATEFAPLGLHRHPLHRQRAKAKRVAKRSSYRFKFHHAPSLRLLVNSIQ